MDLIPSATKSVRQACIDILSKGIEREVKGNKHPRILMSIIGSLVCSPTIPPKLACNYSSRADMILHYTDILIKHKIELGYYWRGCMYMDGAAGCHKDMNKAIAVWIEADKEKLAGFAVYYDYLRKYSPAIRGMNGSTNTLIYLENALKVSNNQEEEADAYAGTISLYGVVYNHM